MSAETPVQKPSPRKLRLAGIIAVAIVTVIVVAGLSLRAFDNKQLRDWTDEQAIPSVTILKPRKRATRRRLIYPVVWNPIRAHCYMLASAVI
jgi:hypothetical protein